MINSDLFQNYFYFDKHMRLEVFHKRAHKFPSFRRRYESVVEVYTAQMSISVIWSKCTTKNYKIPKTLLDLISTYLAVAIAALSRYSSEFCSAAPTPGPVTKKAL